MTRRTRRRSPGLGWVLFSEASTAQDAHHEAVGLLTELRAAACAVIAGEGSPASLSLLRKVLATRGWLPPPTPPRCRCSPRRRTAHGPPRGASSGGTGSRTPGRGEVTLDVLGSWPDTGQEPRLRGHEAQARERPGRRGGRAAGAVRRADRSGSHRNPGLLRAEPGRLAQPCRRRARARNRS